LHQSIFHTKNNLGYDSLLLCRITSTQNFFFSTHCSLLCCYKMLTFRRLSCIGIGKLGSIVRHGWEGSVANVVYAFRLKKTVLDFSSPEMAIHEDWLDDNEIAAFLLGFTLVYGRIVDLNLQGEISISEEDKYLVNSAHRKIIDMGLSEKELIGYHAADDHIPEYAFYEVQPERMLKEMNGCDDEEEGSDEEEEGSDEESPIQK
jgi:hypothetical protein